MVAIDIDAPHATSIWAAIQEEACKLASSEPLMRSHLERKIAARESLIDCVAGVLSDCLGQDDDSQAALFELMRGNMQDMSGFEAILARDLAAVKMRDPACTTFLHALLNLKGLQALQAHRVAHSLWKDGRQEISSWLCYRTSVVLGPDIHPAARIGSGIMLDHGSGIVIGETAVVDDDVSILQNVTLGGTGKTDGDRHPKIGTGVMIGAGAKIIGNIRVGRNCKVAAGSVLLKDIPANCTVAGVPAQIVRVHESSEIPAEAMDQAM